jgi:non-specific protein-tyrosine kinase
VEVLTLVQAQADVVLVDSPPVLPVTDALVLSGRVDATFLVVVAGSTSRTEAARAVALLRQVDAPLIGAVLNGVQHDAAYGGYAYQYYRTHEHEAKPAPHGDAAVLAGRR